jgi:MFS family permease
MNDTGIRAGRRISLGKTFASLKHRNFRLWFWGQMVSLFGTWMQMTALGFLVFELTNSPAFLGYVGFAAGIPSWILMMYGGVIADRMSRRTLLITTQTAMMIQALLLAYLTFNGDIQAWHIIMLAFLLGVANAFDAPARLAFISEMVDREDLTNAIALNAMMFNLSSAVGPAVAGIIYAAFGAYWCFTINAVSFIAVIVALLAMRIKEQVRTHQSKSTLSSLKEGLQYVRREPVIRSLIVLIAASSLFGTSLGTLLPAWAVTILSGGAETNGLLYSARGIGSLIGALTIASISHMAVRGKLITIGSFAFPLLVACFALSRWIPLSLLSLAAVGISVMMVVNVSNAMIQSLVPDVLRGRVMGVYSTVFMGSMPLGALLLGTVAEHAGEAEAVFVASAAALLTAVFIALFAPRIRALK